MELISILLRARYRHFSALSDVLCGIMKRKGRIRTMGKDNLSKILIDLRKGKNLTQKALASKLDYSDKVISKWETGQSLPDVTALGKLAEFYDVSIDSIVKGRLQKDSDPSARDDDHKIVVQPVRKPSKYTCWSLVIWTLLFLSTLFGDIVIFLFAGFIYSMVLFVYGIVLSYYTWEGEHEGHLVIVRNRPLKATLELDGETVDQNTSLLSTHIRLTGMVEGRTLKAYIHGFFAFSCDIYLE